MRWRGETLEQMERRLTRWHRRFAYVPVQMHDGTWVWWEPYDAIQVRKPNQTFYVLRRLPGSDFKAPYECPPPRPPAPSKR